MSVAETTELVRVQPMTLDREAIELLKTTICAGATDAELKLFVQASQRLGLDPFARQVFAVKRWDGNAGREVMAIQVSIDGFRLVAERTRKYAGQRGPFWTADGKEWVDVWLGKSPPAAAKVGVLRHDFNEPIWAVATWDQYKQEKRNGGLTAMWAKMGPLMLAKCAESLALRRAFPNELSGVYTQEEMSQASPAEPEDREPINPAYRATVNDREVGSGPKGAAGGAATRTVTVSASPTTTAPASSASNQVAAGSVSTTGSDAPKADGCSATDGAGSGSTPRTAADVPHDGISLSPPQLKRIHALKKECGGKFSGEEGQDSLWSRVLGVYRDQQGDRIDTSAKLSKRQASHLIGRMERHLEKATVRAADVAAEVSNVTGETEINLDDAFQAAFDTDQEQTDWIRDVYGVAFESPADIPPHMHRLTVELLLAYRVGGETYNKALARFGELRK